MTGQSFTTTVSVEQSPKEVFDAVRNVRGWWSKGLEGASEQPGDEFVFNVPGIHRSKIRVTEAVPNERVVWHVLDTWLDFADGTEWNDTHIRFEITERDGRTHLQFTHDGLVPQFECYDACHAGWAFYINTSLRDLITTGTGQADEMPEQIAALEAKAAAAS